MHINDLGDFMARFMKQLDIQQPDWWITRAEQLDLIEYARATADIKDVLPRMARARDQLRRRTAERLTLGVRAAVHEGLVTTNGF